jgi:penicillin-insensitive murein endopeptidase
VHAVVVDAYAALEKSMPGTIFVYGETGLKDGGRFDPHKTHQNGLSVDFMVPVLDREQQSVPLPTSAWNKWGYDLEFDASGSLDALRIDYEAIAEHVYQLHIAAGRHGIGIWRVIFDPQLQPYLHTTRRWPYLSENVAFSEKRSWVRHDEHYHVDFDVDCESIG